MAEYVKLEALKEAFKSVTDDCTCPIHLAAEIDQILDQSPVADVAPVRHGRWIAVKVPNEWDKGQCSECKSIFNSSVWGTKYCSNCGAKMDGGNNDV